MELGRAFMLFVRKIVGLNTFYTFLENTLKTKVFNQHLKEFRQ